MACLFGHENPPFLLSLQELPDSKLAAKGLLHGRSWHTFSVRGVAQSGSYRRFICRALAVAGPASFDPKPTWTPLTGYSP
jgi:hypothetical protein